MSSGKTRREIVIAVMKDAIFEAAGSVLEEHGVGGMTMERVATTAGLTAGSLYNYFQNKDDLLRFVFSRLVEPFFTAIQETSNANLSAPEKLKEIFSTAAKNGSKHRGLTRLLKNSDQYSQIKKSTRSHLDKILMGICEQGISEGSLRPHHTEQASRLLMGALAELFDLQASAASGKEIADYICFVDDMVLAGWSTQDQHARHES